MSHTTFNETKTCQLNLLNQTTPNRKSNVVGKEECDFCEVSTSQMTIYNFILNKQTKKHKLKQSCNEL